MSRKKIVCQWLAVLILWVLILVPAGGGWAAPAVSPQNPMVGHGHGAAAAVSAEQALQMLTAGNERFVQNKLTAPPQDQARRSELAQGQHPFAVVLTCSDSRVPPELVFNQGLGDIFVIRVAGNVLDAIGTGSVEYAVEHLNSKLVVVLGHEKCGAVKATVDGGEFPDNIKAIAAKIQPAVTVAKTAKGKDVYEAATEINVTNMVEVLKKDPVLLHSEGVKIVGAKYQLESGRVVFLP